MKVSENFNDLIDYLGVFKNIPKTNVDTIDSNFYKTFPKYRYFNKVWTERNKVSHVVDFSTVLQNVRRECLQYAIMNNVALNVPKTKKQILTTWNIAYTLTQIREQLANKNLLNSNLKFRGFTEKCFPKFDKIPEILKYEKNADSVSTDFAYTRFGLYNRSNNTSENEIATNYVYDRDDKRLKFHLYPENKEVVLTDGKTQNFDDINEDNMYFTNNFKIEDLVLLEESLVLPKFEASKVGEFIL